MKLRTIEDLHDKDYGHAKFAKFVDLAIQRGHEVTEIKEYYEKFKFKLDGHPFEYDKTVKFDANWFLNTLEAMMKMEEEFENAKKRQNV